MVMKLESDDLRSMREKYRRSSGLAVHAEVFD